MNMRNKKWADDFSPIDPEGTSYVDTCYSKAYLRHLFISEEILAMQMSRDTQLGILCMAHDRRPRRQDPGRHVQALEGTRWCAA